MTAVVFKDTELQARFESDGYVVFDFITPEQAAQIAEKFYQTHDVIPGGFYSTASNPEDSFKEGISNHAEQIIAADMERSFQNIRKLGITFLCKAPGPDGKVPVHRDWLVVDELKYFSGTIWVPLSDVNEANGALRVLPGSHKFFNDLRSSSLQPAYKGYEDEIWEQMTTVPMRAGQAFLLNHAVIHASSPNLTNKERLILVCGIIPDGAKLSYYHGTGKGTVEKLDMPDDMFMRHSDIGDRPRIGVKVAEFDYEVKVESPLKIQQLITTAKSERSIKPLFKDVTLQTQFATKGYVKLPVLNGNDIAEFIETPDAKKAGKLSGSLTEKLVAHISSAVGFAPEKLQVIEATLGGGNTTSIPEQIHQELSYADENEYCSVTCWIPLTNTSIGKGAMALIEGSHLFIGNKRPTPQLQAMYTFNESMLDILPYMQAIDLKAGEALIFDHRLFHCVLPAGAATTLLSINIKLTDAKAQLLHYYLNPDGKKDSMLKYEVDRSFFQNYSQNQLAALYQKGEKIEGYKLAETISYKHPRFTTAEAIELIKENGGVINRPLTQWLANADKYKAGILKMERLNAIAKNSPQQDERDFWHKYTPLNIVREIKKRVMG